MYNILLTFSYDGSKFHGFQRQKKDRSVQKDLEVALSNIYKEEIVIKGAGRTDAKVHAKGQCANFLTNKKVNNIKDIINDNIKDIVVTNLEYVDLDFHARFNAKEKKYIYQMSLDEDDDFNYYGYYYGSFNFEAMKKGIKLFIGSHDFNNFVAGKRDDYHTYIRSAKVVKIKNRIYFSFVGTGFYRYMVRNLVGALIDLGRGKITIQELSDMLEKPDVEKSLSTAKAEGLYLIKVKY